MAQNFLRAERDQPFLLPPDMRDWLPSDDLVWLVLEAVEQCDLTAFTVAYRADGQGRPAYEPALMVALLLHAYCHGVRSSREIERRCQRDIAFRVIAGGHRPDHATIARFRARHEGALETVFTEILRLCAEAGMVTLTLLAIDGTKVAADASWSANRSEQQLTAELDAAITQAATTMLGEAAAADAADDARFGDERGDELPEALRSPGGRVARLREARDRLAADRQAVQDAQQAKIDAWDQRLAAGQPTGRRPDPVPPTVNNSAGKAPRANSTDPQARTVKTKHTLLVGYNAQAVVTADQVIVGATVMQKEVDCNLLHPVLGVARQQLVAAGIRPVFRTVLADSGYVTEEAFRLAHEQQIRLLAPKCKDTRAMRDGGDPGGGRDLSRLPETARGQRRLRHQRGRADYRQRGRTVEPVFGQLKTRQQMTRFSRRGITAVTSEWHLACAAHNLLKLQAHKRK